MKSPEKLLSICLSVTICACALFCAGDASSDMVTMKDNRIIKGVVVENYHDRIVVSTYEGEVFLKKAEILRLTYDTELMNLLSLAEMATERGKYRQAYGYYDKAYKINPDSRQAKDGKIYIQTLLFKKEELQKMAEIDRRKKYEEQGVTTFFGSKPVDREESLKKELGISIRIGEVNPQVIDVEPGSSAHRAGLEIGDKIVEIWGRLTGYMNQEQVLTMLMEKSPKERKITIERVVTIKISNERGFLPNSDKLIGATFTVKIDGLTVASVREGAFAERAGLKENDLVISVDGSPTRYMPMKIAIELIQSSKKDTVDLTIRRELSIW